MKIVYSPPPNYEAIVAAFPAITQRYGVLFAYGDTIYNPDGVTVTAPLMAHEEVHCRQQGDTPGLWWESYIENATYRFGQELEAHRAEWKKFLEDAPNRHQRRGYLSNIAHRLSSGLYGKMCSLANAKILIGGLDE